MAKTAIKAKLTKLSINSDDKMDSIQFRLDEDGMEKYGASLLLVRRFDEIKIRIINNQGNLSDNGEVQFLDLETQAMNISISICVTDKGFICTMTISSEDRELCGKLLAHNARNQELDLQFEDGKNPFLPN